ncbi:MULTISPECIES: EamA family transporter [Caldimonas]|uniref:EamA family transporter n=1 Tax=Caldimonas TaxID=196013 RepID=UPI00039ABDAC|nr:EamA family transporter [Caldimonas manganoxidans]
MSRSVLGLILVNVLLTSMAQIILKAGMSADTVQASLAQGARWSTAWTVGTHPFVLCGLALYFASAVLWLLILAKVEVSLAYPFVGLGFVITMLLAWWIHGDSLTLTRIAGTVLIAVGVAILAHQ